MTAGVERTRMADAGHPEEGRGEASPWYRWGPYLAERAWGSVPAEGTQAGMVVREGVPGIAIRAVVLAHGDTVAGIGASHRTGWTGSPPTSSAAAASSIRSRWDGRSPILPA